MRVISLGWGVQSWTLAAMAALGEIEADVAIHADTRFEKSETYVFAAYCTPWLEAKGLRVVTVQGDPFVAKAGETHIPAYTTTAKGGQLRRQCTNHWKIEPIRRWVSEELKRQGLTKRPGIVESLQGISLDEWQRMKDADVKYIIHRYPLVDMKMTRNDCVTWLAAHDLPVPPKSACVFCPFQSLNTWRELKRNGGQDWETAVEIDLQIRDVSPPALYVHPARKPLAEAVTIPEDSGLSQATMFDGDGCESGYCFV
jgi:hypothetical protein